MGIGRRRHRQHRHRRPVHRPVARQHDGRRARDRCRGRRRSRRGRCRPGRAAFGARHRRHRDRDRGRGADRRSRRAVLETLARGRRSMPARSRWRSASASASGSCSWPSPNRARTPGCGRCCSPGSRACRSCCWRTWSRRGVSERGSVGRSWCPAVAIGLLIAGSNVTYLLSTREGLLSVVAVVVAMYPASTICLASVIDGERATPAQLTGMALAVGCAGDDHDRAV